MLACCLPFKHADHGLYYKAILVISFVWYWKSYCCS